jgi:hypothetical protein
MGLKMAQIVATQRIRNRQLIQHALDLRKTGATYSQIARHLSLSTTRAYQLVRAGMDEVKAELKETALNLRQMELDRLDAIHFAHWPRRANPRNADVILRVMERRARLLGLDAPAKIAETIPEGKPSSWSPDLSRLTDEELAQLEAIYTKLGQR